MQYYKDTPQGRVWFSGFLKLKDGSLMTTNSKEILEREGWTPYEPQAPILYMGNDPIPEDVKLKKLFEKYPECKDIVKTISTGIVYHYSTWDVLFKGILSADNINNE